MARGWKLLLLALPLVWGCASDPPPLPEQPRKGTGPQPHAARETPQGVLAPVDAWKRNLAERLRKPWVLVKIEPQVQAPHGWTRIRGSRGLALTFANGEKQQRFWVMPREFEGRPIAPREAARQRARSKSFLLFEPHTNAPGWNATAEVIVALGMS